MITTLCICIPLWFGRAVPLVADDSLTAADLPSQVQPAWDRVAAMEIIRKDVVVAGLGAFGSAALWRLAHRGVDVAGIERHGIGHHLGSSHGLTRLFRVACQEHPGLAPIALKSLELWTGLGEETGQRLVRQSDCLSVGPPDSRAVTGAIA